MPEVKGISRRMATEDDRLKLVSEGCDPRIVSTKCNRDYIIILVIHVPHIA